MRTNHLHAAASAANDADAAPAGPGLTPQPLTREAGHLSWPPLTPTDQLSFTRLVDYQLRLTHRQGQTLAVLALRLTQLEAEAAPDGGSRAALTDEVEAELLRELGRRLRLRLRAQDSVSWLGGRVFGVVLLCVDEAQARMVAARLCRLVGGRYCLRSGLLNAQVALGVAAHDRTQRSTGLELVQRAVEALAGQAQ